METGVVLAYALLGLREEVTSACSQRPWPRNAGVRRGSTGRGRPTPPKSEGASIHLGSHVLGREVAVDIHRHPDVVVPENVADSVCSSGGTPPLVLRGRAHPSAEIRSKRDGPTDSVLPQEGRVVSPSPRLKGRASTLKTTTSSSSLRRTGWPRPASSTRPPGARRARPRT